MNTWALGFAFIIGVFLFYLIFLKKPEMKSDSEASAEDKID